MNHKIKTKEYNHYVSVERAKIETYRHYFGDEADEWMDRDNITWLGNRPTWSKIYKKRLDKSKERS